MEKTNSVGLTFKQLVDAANATGWTNHNSNYKYTDHMMPIFKAFLWTVEWIVILFGVYFIGYYLYNYYQSKRNK